MKTKNTKKIVVSALAVAMGAGLVGSISGTVAWYQYSTRSTVAFVGTSIGTSNTLQVKVSHGSDAGEFKTDYATTDTTAVLGAANQKVAPVTTGDHANNTALGVLKKNPIFGVTEIAKWKTAEVDKDYVQFKLNFQVYDNVAKAVSTDTRNVYLENLVIRQATTGATKDVSPAIRVHLAAGDKYALVSQAGEAIATSGNLKLKDGTNNDNGKRFEWDDDDVLTYGSGTQTCYKQDSGDIIATTTDPYIPTGGFNFPITTQLTVTIFMEGWQELGGDTTWDTDYINNNFNVGLSFTTEAEAAA